MKKLTAKEFNKYLLRPKSQVSQTIPPKIEQPVSRLASIEMKEAINRLHIVTFFSDSVGEIVVPLQDGLTPISYCAVKVQPIDGSNNALNIDVPCKHSTNSLTLTIDTPSMVVVQIYYRVIVSKIPLKTLVKTFVQEMYHICKNSINNRILSSKKLYSERIHACENCDRLQIESYRCMVCGCYVKAKAKLYFARCPESTW